MDKITCCKDCEVRTLGCHGTCEKYLAEREALDEYNKQVRSGKEADRVLKRYTKAKSTGMNANYRDKKGVSK